MELFRYRNVALGCGCFLLTLIASFFFGTIFRVVTLALAGVAALFLFAAFLIKRSVKIRNLLIRFTPCLILIVISATISIFQFDKSEVLSLCDEQEHQITATVKEIEYSSQYIGIFSAQLSTVDGQELDEPIELVILDSSLPSAGDVISARGTFSRLEQTSYNLASGTVVSFEAMEYKTTSHETNTVLDILSSTNKLLDGQLAKLNHESHHLMSALFLGNKQSLGENVKRDFSRIGLSHVLALSGMHITIVITLLGFIISKTRMKRIFQELVLIFATLFFVGMTGFSDSAMRAGLMVTLTLLFSFIGNRMGSVTALFLSVTLICALDPFSVFSLSLILSFFAMLGCIISLKFIHRVRFFKSLRNPILRYILVTLITSVFAVLITLPIIYFVFGRVSLLSPISNLVLSPLFTVLIYSCPFYLLLSWIPYVGTGVGWVLEKLCSFTLFLGEKAASLDNILLPIIDYIQIAGVILISLFVLYFLICRRKRVRLALCGIGLGVLTIAVGSFVMLYSRGQDVYVGADTSNSGDAIFVEDTGTLTLFQVGTSHFLCLSTAQRLGYYEIDNYVFTDYYAGKTIAGFATACAKTIVKRAYIPSPQSKEEQAVLDDIKEIATEMNVEVCILGTEIKSDSVTVKINDISYVAGSNKRSVALFVDSGNSRFTYLSSGAFRTFDDTFYKEVSLSDVIVFGSSGPNYKMKYTYNIPYLDACVFLGNSKDFASKDFLKQVGSKDLTQDCEFYRFKLKATP